MRSRCCRIVSTRQYYLCPCSFYSTFIGCSLTRGMNWNIASLHVHLAASARPILRTLGCPMYSQKSMAILMLLTPLVDPSVGQPQKISRRTRFYSDDMWPYWLIRQRDATIFNIRLCRRRCQSGNFPYHQLRRDVEVLIELHNDIHSLRPPEVEANIGRWLSAAVGRMIQ